MSTHAIFPAFLMFILFLCPILSEVIYEIGRMIWKDVRKSIRRNGGLRACAKKLYPASTKRLGGMISRLLPKRNASGS